MGSRAPLSNLLPCSQTACGPIQTLRQDEYRLRRAASDPLIIISQVQ